MIDPTSSLLQRDHKYKYVMLGVFSTNPMEKTFSKLGQGCGGSYFITTLQVHEKVFIRMTNPALKSGLDYSAFSSSSVAYPGGAGMWEMHPPPANFNNLFMNKIEFRTSSIRQ